ncbi:hypothetical protein [Amycolatopsis pigmentata]|uniref:DUF4145 domain-containing protein n=1 Tax=Amycolatopsis pigmentata TaxID=450801 RepID=A0ABW5FJC7_9PSEU
MEGAILWEFFASALWPIVALVGLVMYRTPVGDLIRKITHAEVAGVKIDVDRLEAATGEAADAAREVDAGQTSSETARTDENAPNAYAERAALAELSPAALIMQSYREVELALQDLFDAMVKSGVIKDGASGTRRPASPLFYLEKNGFLHGALASLLRELRHGRNVVTHTRDEPTAAEALAFAESADVAKALIEQHYGKIGLA